MRSLLARLAALGALAAVLGGCSTSTSPLPNAAAGSSGGGGVANLSAYTQSAYVRFVMGNPNYTAAKPLFICVDQSTLGGAGFSYPPVAGATIQSAALTLPAGAHIISVYDAVKATAAYGGSPCSTAPNNVPNNVASAGTVSAPLSIFTATLAANTRYSIVIGGVNLGPQAFGFIDSVPAAITQPAVIFHDASVTASQPAGTAAGAPIGASLSFTNGTTTATLVPATSGRLGNAVASSSLTGAAGNIAFQLAQLIFNPASSSPPALAGSTQTAVALPSAAQLPGTVFTAASNGAVPSVATNTVAGSGTTGLTSYFLLDGAAAPTLLSFSDPTFAQLGY